MGNMYVAREGAVAFLQRIVNKVRNIANAYPDAVYNTDEDTGQCSYYKGFVENGPDQEGCIVGQAMVPEIAVTISGDVIEACTDGLNLIYWQEAIDAGYDAIEGGFPIEEYPDVSDDVAPLLNWLSEVQALQDSGYSWGTAVKQADERYPLPV